MEPADVILKPGQYLLVIQGKPEGPFSINQVKELKVKPNDFLKTFGMIDYKEAHEIEELREILGFKKEALIPQYFASFDQRLMAAALDWFFVSGICIILAFIAMLTVKDQQSRIVIGLSLMGIIPAVKLIYNIAMECSSGQASFGKRILKIKVCDMQGYRLSPLHSTGRNLAKIFSVSTFFVGYLLSFFTKQQQCLHDMIAGTLVMKDRLI